MSLLTRCHACHMVFHVVQDQLKVSEGWVRCGRCGEVFNALEHLFEADAPAPAGTPAPAPTAGAPTTEPDSQLQTDFGVSTLAASDFGPLPAPSRQPPTWDLPPLAEPPSVPAVTAVAVPVPSLTVVLPQPPTVTPPTATTDPAPPPEEKAPQPPAPAATPEAPPVAAPASPAPAPAPAPPAPEAPPAVPPETAAAAATDGPPTVHPVPGFLQDTAATRWYHRRWARWMMALLVPLLVLVLGLQVLVQYRNELSTHYTGLRGYLVKMCSVVGCQLESPRVLDQLVLVSSKIQQTSAKNVLHLRAELHNRARHPVRTPSLDLTLTDAYGQVLVRKMLHPQELRSPGESIKGSNSWQISAFIDVGTLPVAGFSLVLFYP